MGVSETIAAAVIGALATMMTAVFQLVRNRAPSESRPKKNRVRSVVATAALMLACVVGGYAWSEWRSINTKEQLKEQLAELLRAEVAAPLQAMSGKNGDAGVNAAGVSGGAGTTGGGMPAHNAPNGSAESLAHLPPCKLAPQAVDAGPSKCSESVAHSVSLCASIPSVSHTTAVRVLSRVPGGETPWLERPHGAPALGNLHIAEAPFEYAVSADKRSVCLNVANWGTEETLAVRLVVEFASGTVGSELTAAAPTGHTL